MKPSRTYPAAALSSGAPTRGESRLHAFGLRGMQARASFFGGNFPIAGTYDVEATAIDSMPVAEGFVP